MKNKNLIIEIFKFKDEFLTNVIDEISVSTKSINRCIDDIKNSILKSNYPNLTLIYSLDNSENELLIKEAIVLQ